MKRAATLSILSLVLTIFTGHSQIILGGDLKVNENSVRKILEFDAGMLHIGINLNGSVVSLFSPSLQKEFIPLNQVFPLLSILTDSQRLEPSRLVFDKKKQKLSLFYSEGKVRAEIEVKVHPYYLRFKLKSISGVKPSRIEWGPFPTTINRTVGETVGVVRDEMFAIGIQALNEQTVAGASHTDYGSKLYAYAEEKEGGVKDSAIALFGCKSSDALRTIGEIEIAEGLPHPMLDGVWAKISPSATLSYLITDFSEANFEEALQLCKKFGFKYLYHPGPFATWGHFILEPNRFPDGDESLKRCVDKAKKEGIRVGLHTLSAFITPNDPYVSPKPDPRLGGLGSSKLPRDLGEKDEEIPVADKEPFIKGQNWGWDRKFVLIEEEIIEYREVADSNPVKLIGCTRGMFGTKATPHKAGTEVKRLATHAYGTFYPGIFNGMMDEMVQRLVELFNYCGLNQISFDGLEGLWDYECKGPYAAHRFVKGCYDGWKEEVINDASGLLHYLWHIHTRMNWGEPWGKPMKEGMPEYRLKNQDYFERNMFPHMMGWFEFRLASSHLQATTLDEIEWMLSKCAGCDAGFALVTSPEVFKAHGQGEEVAKAIREWEEARHLGAFSEEQKIRLKELNSDWHLERIGKNRWLLFPVVISPLFHYPPADQSVRAEWKINNPFQRQPLRFVLRVLPQEGKDLSVSNPSFEVNGKKATFLLELKPTQYLVCEGDGIGSIYDWNWNLLYEVKCEGEFPILEYGEQSIYFTCTLNGSTAQALSVTFKTIGEPEEVSSHTEEKN